MREIARLPAPLTVPEADMMISRSAAAVILATATLACAAENPPPATSPSNQAPPADAAVTETEALDLGSAAVDRPSGWAFRTPTSSMRLAEAEVPGPGGPGLLTVFFFGPGGGGGVEANLERWVGQMEAAPGSTPTRDSFETGGFTVSTVAVEGILLPSRMGGGPTEPVPGSQLFGAVIEGPGGPWFFKLTGPDATVAAAADDFRSMLRSVRSK
jgi:hypothetical protein